MRLKLQPLLNGIRLRVLGGAVTGAGAAIHHLVVDSVLLHQEVIHELFLLGELRFKHVHLSAQLSVLVLQKIACHLVPENVIIEALTFLSNVFRTHLLDLQVHGTRIFRGERGSIVTLHAFIECGEAPS
jgi:hypothetical protein